MATTGFWPIKGRLKDAIDYAENPDKTTDRKYLDEDLYSALRYAANDAKDGTETLTLQEIESVLSSNLTSMCPPYKTDHFDTRSI